MADDGGLQCEVHGHDVDLAWTVGLSCGGKLEVFIEPLS